MTTAGRLLAAAAILEVHGRPDLADAVQALIPTCAHVWVTAMSQADQRCTRCGTTRPKQLDCHEITPAQEDPKS